VTQGIANREKTMSPELAQQRVDVAEQRADAAQQQADAASKRAETGATKVEDERGKLANQLGKATQEAIEHGLDTAQSPKVQQLTAQIKGLQKQPTEPQLKAVTLELPGGKKVAGVVARDGSLLTEDGQPAPQGTILHEKPQGGAALAPTKTVTVMGADGIPRI